MNAAEPDLQRPGTLWVRNLDWPAPENAAPRVPVDFSCLDPEAIGTFAEALRLDQPALLQQRLTAGKRCYAARVEGVLAAYGWVSWQEEDIGEIGLRLHLMPGEAYIWDCATAPSHRRLRVYTALLAHITEQLRAEGLCRVWIGADADNSASQHGMALAGFQPVADLVVTRVIGLRRFWVRGRPGVPEVVVDDARRALVGDRDRTWMAALATIKSIPAQSH
jgi:ribosomal protein S18 acetylase RimI-like enzyme